MKGDKRSGEKQPKRSWRRNIWGNVVGYEGGRRVEEFGCRAYADKWAEIWASGETRERAETIALGLDPDA